MRNQVLGERKTVLYVCLCQDTESALGHTSIGDVEYCSRVLYYDTPNIGLSALRNVQIRFQIYHLFIVVRTEIQTYQQNISCQDDIVNSKTGV